MGTEDSKKESTRSLLQEIEEVDVNTPIETNLHTSDRVLARITDGIYRLPSSAIRELISNAYDADATRVEVQTNPPNFDEIVVQDDGNGLTLEALVHLIHNIGGSTKRTRRGMEINVCSSNDPTRSPGGRKLIGKIGIGLFSVAQLTKTFQIITKRKNESFRTVADVVLQTHSEDDLMDGDEFVTGSVKIWKVPAEDILGHGTRIILRNLLPKTRDHLRSKEEWMKSFPEDYESTASLNMDKGIPKLLPEYHIGRIDPKTSCILNPARFPWDESKRLLPNEKMKAMADVVFQLRTESKKPSIAKVFDNYFQMIWTLGLSAPVNYVEGHPFDIKLSEMPVYELSNDSKGQAIKLEPCDEQTVRDKLRLTSPERGVNSEFKVIIDGIELLRPIKYRNLPVTTSSGLSSMLFVGRAAPDLSKVPKEIRGGDLEFEAYFLWNSAIAPKEHAGILLRINDAAGTMFDETFLKYPVSETIRMSQVVAEVFIKKGMDAALNIDRESFNYSHPHYQVMAAWVHNAFRQLANKQKELASSANRSRREEKLNEFSESLRTIVDSIKTEEDYPFTSVVFTADKAEIPALRVTGTLAYDKVALQESSNLPVISSSVEEKVKAIIQILDKMHLLDSVSYSMQEELIAKITAIISK